jgi:hypothetical protein
MLVACCPKIQAGRSILLLLDAVGKLLRGSQIDGGIGRENKHSYKMMVLREYN